MQYVVFYIQHMNYIDFRIKKWLEIVEVLTVLYIILKMADN